MNLKDYFESIDLREIEDFVENKVSESLFKEFKTANFPQVLEFDKKNFSKCLSGFSNSSGGIIVWGISAKEQKDKPDVADELKPISNLMAFESYLKKNEGNAIIPLLENVEYKRILDGEDKGYLIVLIPASERAPHMGLFADKRYYKRSGDSFYQCEHFDIIDMMNRKYSPKLQIEIVDEEVFPMKHGNDDRFRYRGMLSLKNFGNVSAHHIEISIRIKQPFKTWNFGIDGNGNSIFKKINVKSDLIRYTGGSNVVLHPESVIEIDKVWLNENFPDFDLADLYIEYSIVAENMATLKGTIERTKEEIIKKTNH